MSEECGKESCEGCSEHGCSHRQGSDAANAGSDIKKVIGVISGKGGVGKSTVCALLAGALKEAGKSCVILDADITGPSIAKIYGIKDKAGSNGEAVLPAASAGGVKVMSINMLLENETDPVIWRGPIISATVRQFWTEVAWGSADVMLVDMPPGTGDVPLTVFQSLPIDGVVVVTTPQELVSMIVEKAVKMAEAMGIPVLGLVENMSYFDCPDCGKRHEIFGPGRLSETAERFGVKNTARLPIRPERMALCDAGKADELKAEELEEFCRQLLMEE
ncbi:MAG: Mrp/NBP35 family ATP-binding protein [Lachnospiraceae bacterium]|nr:Mrp/NBP35 family ATP-binding protein [Lachnospiraceae bacterium]